MITKLEFDMFYTIIKTPDIAEKKLKNQVIKKLKTFQKRILFSFNIKLSTLSK